MFEDREYSQSVDTFNISEELVEKATERVNPIKSQGPDKIYRVFCSKQKASSKSLQRTAFRNHLMNLSSPMFENSLASLPEKLMEMIVRDNLVEHV